MAKQQEVALERLGAEVAQTFSHFDAERAHAIEQARWGFLGNANPSPNGAFALRWPLALGFAVSALSLCALLVFALRAAVAPLTFKVDGRDGAVQSWLAAQAALPVRLDFSDGTAFRLEHSSRARVTEVARDGARIALESGSLHAEVVHTGSSHWELVTGPLTVRVTGTRFDLNWNPVSQLFSIHVLEGSVAVSGAIAGPEHFVRGGETLWVSVPEQRLELTRGQVAAVHAQPQPSENGGSEPRAASAPGSALAAADSSPRGAAPTSSSSSSESAPLARKSERPAWRELAARGALREAFAAAEASGFDQACQSASASELLLLGDAARLAGRPERVSEALLSLRQRYPGDSRRAAAAFMLGKVAFDQKRAFAQAASWFSTCIREQPGGSLAREASGRRIEALRAAGDSKAAENAARDYLAHYPRGPHAPLARSLLP